MNGMILGSGEKSTVSATNEKLTQKLQFLEVRMAGGDSGSKLSPSVHSSNQLSTSTATTLMDQSNYSQIGHNSNSNTNTSVVIPLNMNNMADVNLNMAKNGTEMDIPDENTGNGVKRERDETSSSRPGISDNLINNNSQEPSPKLLKTDLAASEDSRGGNGSQPPAATGKSDTTGMKPLTHFFAKPPNGVGTTAAASSSSAVFKAEQASPDSKDPSNKKGAKTLASKQALNQTVASTQAVQDLQKKLEISKAGKMEAENRAQRLEEELRSSDDRHRSLMDHDKRLRKSMEEVRREMAQKEARRKRDQLALNCVRLGKLTTKQLGPTSYGEIWEDGFAVKDLSRRQAELIEREEELDRRKKALATLRRQAKRGSGADDEDLDLDLTAENEAIKNHVEQLKKDKSSLAEEKRLLDSEKAAHQKELRRCQSEDRSRFFRDLPCLNERYLLVSLLGRGGFSEVWRAFDLVELKDVAIKVHQLTPGWSDERKQSYIKHVTREYTIHRDMRHPRVVQLFDVFEIDVNSFATVLEYCRGIDLDEKLKRMRTIPEKDARSILLQIMSGLRYLNTPGEGASDTDEANHGSRRMAVIHYDLKPANILFDEMGDAKITDFGLSKVIDESDEGTSLELTSQGAGTYWYLPPECFEKPARISSKVDVWSVGVIFYQMLYGRRPFGEGMSQEQVLSSGTIRDAKQVIFPTDAKAPKISPEAQGFIKACLTHDQRLRPDIKSLCLNSYLLHHK